VRARDLARLLEGAGPGHSSVTTHSFGGYLLAGYISWCKKNRQPRLLIFGGISTPGLRNALE